MRFDIPGFSFREIFSEAERALLEKAERAELAEKVADALLATGLDVVLWPRATVLELARAAIEAVNRERGL